MRLKIQDEVDDLFGTRHVDVAVQEQKEEVMS